MELALKRESWVLKVAQYGGLQLEDRTDLCSVFWTFLWGLIRAPFLVVFFGCLGAAIGFALILRPIIALIALFAEGAPFDFLAWWAVAVWVGGTWALYEVWASVEDKAAPIQSTVRFAKAGYRSWKDKTCVLIDVR